MYCTVELLTEAATTSTQCPVPAACLRRSAAKASRQQACSVLDGTREGCRRVKCLTEGGTSWQGDSKRRRAKSEYLV